MPNLKPTKPKFRMALGCTVFIALAIGGFILLKVVTNAFFSEDAFWLDSTESSLSTTQKFVNSRQGLAGDQLQHYVDFSFQYPPHWQLERSHHQPGNQSRNSNYVTLIRCPDLDAILQQSCPIPREFFAIGSFWGAEALTGNEPQFQAVLRQYHAQKVLQVPAYQKISAQSIKLGTYVGYEIRYQGKNTQYQVNGQDLIIWGRDIFLPDGRGNGVLLMTVATSLSAEIKSLEDLETQRDLALILKSFKFTAAKSKPAPGFFF